MHITGAKVIPWCISCKNCENICPEIFRVDPQSTVISDTFNQNALKLLLAEKMCPVHVIKVEKEWNYEMKYSRAILKSKTFLTKDVVELVFHTEKFEFLPGQYISLQMRDIRGDFARSYSIVSANENSFTLTVKLHKKWRGSSYLRKLWERSWRTFFTKNKAIQYIGAMGDFVLQNTPERKVMIATGTGLAPMISFLETLPDDTKKLLIFWVRHMEDLFYIEKLKKYKNLELRNCISRPSSPDITSQRVVDQMHDIEKNDEVYVCGNPEMVSQVCEILKTSGHQEDKIHHEDFTLAQKPLPLIKSIFFEGELPGLDRFNTFLMYLWVVGVPIFYTLGIMYDFLGYEIGGKNMYDILFLLTWWAVIFVMFIRPLADIFPKLNILRRWVVLRKWFWIFSASIIVTMLFAKWIQNPATFFSFFTISAWALWLSFVSRISETTAMILLATSNSFSQKILWVWWKRIQKMSYIYFYSGPIIALQYADTVLEYYIPMILLPIVWLLAHFRVQLWK